MQRNPTRRAEFFRSLKFSATRCPDNAGCESGSRVMAKTAARKGQKRRSGRKQAKGGMWPWYLAGVLSVSAAVGL